MEINELENLIQKMEVESKNLADNYYQIDKRINELTMVWRNYETVNSINKFREIVKDLRDKIDSVNIIIQKLRLLKDNCLEKKVTTTNIIDVEVI